MIKATKIVLIPKLYYLLPVTDLNLKESMRIINPAIPLIANAHGLPRTINRSLLLAPKRYGGIGLEKLNIYQATVTAQISWATHHLRLNDTTGKIMKCCMEVIQLEIGIKRNFWETKWDDQKQSLITNFWITKLWRETNNIGIKLLMKRIGLPNMNEGKTIMEIVNTLHWDAYDKRKFNLIRLRLRVIWVEDIFTGSTDQLTPYTDNYPNTILPKTMIPKTWDKFWNSKLNEIKAILISNRGIYYPINEHNHEEIEIIYGNIIQKR